MKGKKQRFLTIITAVLIATAALVPASVLANRAADNTFKDFLTDSNLAAFIFEAQEVTPREIKVKAPKKYVQEIEVIHKKGNALISEDVSITNIDIVTNGEGVNLIMVSINGGPERTIRAPFETDDQIRKFEIGYAGLNENFDIRVRVIDTFSTEVEVLNFKVPAGTTDIFKINEKFTYKTSGKNYSLYELLASKGLFTDLLVEHRIEKIDWEY